MAQAEVVDRPRVLVVDDDAALAEMLTLVLRNEGFISEIVTRGDEAMAPGDLLPLSMPQNLVPADEQQA